LAYEAVAEKAECARSTVAEALRVLEWAGVLSWQQRITRAVVRQRDLWGRWSNRWTVIRTSNAYVFRDPQQPLTGVPAAKSENRTGTQNQDDLSLPLSTPACGKPPTDAISTPMERALAQLARAFTAKHGIEEGAR
jgi:hypothetical protein